MRLRPRTNRLAIPRMYNVLSVGVPASVRYTIIFKFLALGVSASYAIVPAFMVILFFASVLWQYVVIFAPFQSLYD